MSKRRQLSEAEKAEIREDRRKAEEVARPGYRFAVTVEDWTDDDGNGSNDRLIFWLTVDNVTGHVEFTLNDQIDHPLASTDDGGSRYTCPSFEITGPDGRRIDIPGFQPVEVYESAIANLAPDLERRAAPESVEQVLEWAGVPLATVEVAAITGMGPAEARAELARVANETPVGPDGYWSLPAAAASVAA